MNVCTDLRSQTVRGVVLFVLLVSEIVLLVFSFFGVLMWFWLYWKGKFLFHGTFKKKKERKKARTAANNQNNVVEVRA